MDCADDPRCTSVPHTWLTVTVVYCGHRQAWVLYTGVRTDSDDATGVDSLFETEDRLGPFDGSRDAHLVALKRLGEGWIALEHRLEV